jgi:hypothetical protein
MPKIIEVPGQGQFEFPDSMSDDQIASVLQKQFGAPTAPAAPQRERGIVDTIGDKARIFNDYLTLGLWDKAVGAGRAALNPNLDYETAKAQERAATERAKEEAGPLQRGTLAVGAAVPQMMIGGPVSMAAKGAANLVSRAAGPAAQPVANVLASAASPSSILGKTALGIAEGATFGAAEAAARDQEVLPNAGVGAAIGGAIPLAAGAIGRAISPVTSNLNAEQQRLLKEATARGITLTPAQATGNRYLNYAEGMLQDMPGGNMSPRAAQTEQMNNLMLKTAGVDEALATPEVRQAGFDAISNSFNTLLKGEKVKFDQPMRSDVARVVADYTNRLDENVRPMFIRQANALLKGTREVAGDYAQNVRSDIARLEREYASNPSLASAFGGLREAVDDAITRSLPSKADALSQARGEWKNLLRIDEVMSRGGAVADAGNIPVAGIRSSVATKGATPELDTLSRIGSVFMREPPNSGTPGRQQVANLISLASGAGGGAAGYSMGGVPGAIALGVGAPYAANVLYNNPLTRGYLKNQVGRRLEERVTPSFIRMGTQAGLGLLD